VFGTRINHFPFSDHDIIITKLKTEDINRGPGVWIMNLETIKSEQFRHAFTIWWNNWKIEKNKYSDIREWWDPSAHLTRDLIFAASVFVYYNSF
jgi:hypothetical protein